MSRHRAAGAMPTRTGTARDAPTIRTGCTSVQEEQKEFSHPVHDGHMLIENRSGLAVGAVVNHADGFAERERIAAAQLMQRQ